MRRQRIRSHVHFYPPSVSQSVVEKVLLQRLSNVLFLADRINGRAHDTLLYLSVCRPQHMSKLVAKQFVFLKKCMKKAYSRPLSCGTNSP